MKSSHDALAAPLAIPADGLAEKSFPDPRNRSCSTSSSTNSVDATMTSGSVNGDSTPATSPIFVSHTPLSPISNGDTGRRSSSRSTTSTLKSESSASTSNGNRKKSTAGISIMPSSGSRKAREVSAAIDKGIDADRVRMIQEQDDPRLLILGSGDSGKTTLLKQMRLFYGEGFSRDEVEMYRKLLLENIVSCMSAYLSLCDRLGLVITHQAEKSHFTSYSHNGRDSLPAELISVIATLWKEKAVQSVVPLGPKYHIQDTASYFLSRAEVFGKLGYVPTNEDILHIRAPTLAVSETVFKIGIHHYRLFDVGGQRGLRKQWAPFFDNCHSVLFVTSIAGYDQTLQEESEVKVNRLHDAIELFGGVVNNRLLARAEMLLFLNKKDVFEEKLKTLAFSKYFPRYAGANDPESIARYIAAMFKAQRRNPDRKIMIHRTCCTDTRNMEMVVARLIEGLTKSALSRIGAL